MLIRLRGVDAPETSRARAGCELEICLGKAARQVLIDFVERSPSSHFGLEQCVRDKYFRLTCDVVNGRGESAVEAIMQSGLGVQYDGGTKEADWCSTPRQVARTRHAAGCW